MNKDLASYYRDRAKEYEKIYLKPERQDDLTKATEVLRDIFSGKTVVEIACGTGYWTERIAETATTIYATDINESVMEIAKNKHYKNKVAFETVDFYNFSPDIEYESAFGGFIWSHILLQDIKIFLDKVRKFVKSNGTIVFIDNNYVVGSNHPVTKTDKHGNTFQTRILENGTTHLVLKNFPAQDFIFSKLSGIASDIKFLNLKYYWIVSFNVR